MNIKLTNMGSFYDHNQETDRQTRDMRTNLATLQKVNARHRLVN